MTKTRQQVSRFLIVGFTTVAIDFIFYHLLMWLGIELDIAKACSFTIGAVFAYATNKSWTFTRKKHGVAPLSFAILYGATLLVNTFTNGLLVRLLPETAWAITAAFIIATGLSAALNFIGMKWIVFRPDAA
jgi:putative flippase GtrA